MSVEHTGNMQNEILREEHDGLNNAKRVSLVNSSATIYAVVNTSAPGITNSIVTVANIVPVTFSGNVTLDAGSRTGILGNLTLADSKGFIGLVTVGNIVSTTFSGNVTLDPGSKTGIVGNVTLTDSKGFIGLVTVGNTVTVAAHALTAGAAYIGLVTVDIGTTKAWANPNTFIGLVTAVNGSAWPDPKTFIGLTTTTLGSSPAYIGLATVIPAYGSNSTVYTQIVSATGNTTIFVAPASNRFFIKNLHVSSLGRSEVEIRSGATTLIPFTSLSTTAGFASHYGEQGLPGRAQADAFVVNLNGGATISIMVNVRFEA